MHRFTKIFVTVLILGLISSALYASKGEESTPFPAPLSCYSEDYGSQNFLAERCDQIHGVENFRDPLGGSVGEILSHRISANPFNLVVSLIFLIAILHTFMANKLTAKAHQIHEEHDERMKAAGASEEEIKHDIPFKAELFHFLGEVEVVFGMWVIALLFVTIGFFDWTTFKNYMVYDRVFIEPMFVVVIMAIASTRPVVKVSEQLLGLAAGLGGHSIAAWWFSILMIAPLLGSFITEPAAITIAALLLANQFYKHRPSSSFAYATIGLLFVNISVGGTLTHFAAPPVLMVATPWDWSMGFMASNFGWKAAIGILISNVLYFIVFRGQFTKMGKDEAKEASKELHTPEVRKLKPGQMSHDEFEAMWEERDTPIPWWITLVHLCFLAWTVYTAHYPALFIPGLLFFLGFMSLTATHQNKVELKGPIMVGFFLGGLIIHGGLQAWWIAPVLGSLPELPLMITATVLTAFNDNAAITYLATLVPNLAEASKYAVVAGAVTGGGLTVIANAPNPAGQSILGRFFEHGVNPLKLLIAALIPTIIMGICFMVFP
ncbi:putative Na+/H+ antiporter [Deltaproteobacteria bacterium]|nr:putative Na+/H+ antiporter [Deltaproteobacteria bacterium]